MKTLAVLIVWATALSAGLGAQAPTSVETLYADVKAKEKAVRTALEDRSATPAVLKAVRTVVEDYETLVTRFPSSAYADDALWFAGWLSFDAFERFHDDQERSAGIRLWQGLTTQYPGSKLARQVPQQLAKREGTATARATATTTPANASPAVARRAVVEKAAPARAAPRLPPAIIKDIRRTVLPDVVRITIELDREVAFHDERLSNPARVFVDLPSTRVPADLMDRTIRFESDADVVRQIRIGQHPNRTTRVVLDVAGVTAYSVYPLYAPYRLVIDCAREAAISVPVTRRMAPPASPFPLSARPVGSLVRMPLPTPPPSLGPSEIEAAVSADAQRVISDAVPAILPAPQTGSATPSPPSAPPASMAAPSRNVGGGFSIARQLGLGVSRIVIDPGHGGHDPGATGRGVTEASIVLDIALRLEKLLSNVPGVEVILTRRSDDFVGLQERTAIANREGADLFLSIHANANSSAQARGVETYFLNFATTSTAAAVAARENASSGQPMASLPDLVKTIALHNKLDESRDFATHVQRAMIERLRGTNKSVKDLGVKQAPFVVLIGASMPSVLAEIAFLTNSQEARLLRGTAYRQRIAEALFNAIRKYQAALKADSKVTEQ
jgi:N-acetylmuramoyl-L-alanine amidase